MMGYTFHIILKRRIVIRTYNKFIRFNKKCTHSGNNITYNDKYNFVRQ